MREEDDSMNCKALLNPRLWIAMPVVILILFPAGLLSFCLGVLPKAFDWLSDIAWRLSDRYEDAVGPYSNPLFDWINRGKGDRK